MKYLISLLLCFIALGCGSENTTNGGGGSFTGGDKNCSDFSTQAAAQTYFNSRGGSSSNNVDDLDRDHDGIACESLSKNTKQSSNNDDINTQKNYGILYLDISNIPINTNNIIIWVDNISTAISISSTPDLLSYEFHLPPGKYNDINITAYEGEQIIATKGITVDDILINENQETYIYLFNNSIKLDWI